MQHHQKAKSTDSAKYKQLLRQWCDFDNLYDLEYPESIKHNPFYDWKQHIKKFGLGVAVKPGKQEDDGIVDRVYTYFHILF